MRGTRAGLLFATALLYFPRAASGDLVALYAQLQGGGAGGSGLTGEALVQDQAFHRKTAGLCYGAQVGVEVLFVDLWVEHNQFVDADGLLGTWTQFMTGLDLEFDFGRKRSQTRLESGAATGGYSAGYGELGMAAGFGVGTLDQVDPPLDNRQIEDKGFLAQLSAGVGYRFNRSLSVGMSAPVQVGYLFKSGVPANLNNSQYVSVEASLVVHLRGELELR